MPPIHFLFDFCFHLANADCAFPGTQCQPNRGRHGVGTGLGVSLTNPHHMHSIIGKNCNSIRTVHPALLLVFVLPVLLISINLLVRTHQCRLCCISIQPSLVPYLFLTLLSSFYRLKNCVHLWSSSAQNFLIFTKVCSQHVTRQRQTGAPSKCMF